MVTSEFSLKEVAMSPLVVTESVYLKGGSEPVIIQPKWVVFL